MKFEVDSDDLKIVESKFDSSFTSMKDYLSYWRDQIEALKQIWTGEDANIFYIRMEEYLKKLDMLTEVKNELSKAFKNSYIVYENKDQEFAKDLNRENQQYDDTKFKNNKHRTIIDKEGV